MAKRQEGKMEWSNMTAILEAAYIFTRCDSPESFAEEITKWSEKHFYDPQADTEYLISEVERAVDDARYAAGQLDRNYHTGKIEGLLLALETMGVSYRAIENSCYEYSFELNGVVYRIYDQKMPQTERRSEEAC